MTEIPLPKVWNKDMTYLGTVRPIKVSANLNITPLSYASIELPKGESLPTRGYVEIFSSMGSLGIYRVRSPQDAYGDYITTAELEHAIVEVGDYIVMDKIEEMLPANQAMQRIFSHYRGSRWQLGSTSALGSGEIAVQVDHERILEAMISLLEQKPNCFLAFDFTTSPKWTVNIAERDSLVSAEGRLSRNLNYAKVIYDDTELCTRAVYQIETKDADDNPTTEWQTRDADTISTYGIVEREVYIGNDLSSDEINTVVNTFLDKHKEPRISVEMQAQELSQITGESLDTFTIGKLFRLALVDYGITIERTLTGLSWENIYDVPFDINIKLAEEEDTVVTFLHDVDSKGGTMGGGGRGAQEKKWKEYWTRIQQTDHYIDLTAARVDINDSILLQAGLYLDAHGVLVYAQDYEYNIGSKIKVQADRITQIVTAVGDDGEVTAASIIAAINGDTSSVIISADKIDLQGYVTVTQLEATGSARLPTIHAVNVQVDDLSVHDTLYAAGDLVVGASVGGVLYGSLTFQGQAIAKRSNVGVVESVTATPPSLTLIGPHDFEYDLGNGVTATVRGYIVSAFDPGDVTVTAKSINYLGW